MREASGIALAGVRFDVLNMFWRLGRFGIERSKERRSPKAPGMFNNFAAPR